jgi:signal transduction histidine kinase
MSRASLTLRAFTNDSRSTDGGGSGLGLAISREIMVTHGGTVVATEDAGACRFGDLAVVD